MCCIKMTKQKCKIHVLTGDHRGVSRNANVFIMLYDKDNLASTKYKLDNFLQNGFKGGAVDTFQVHLPADFGEVDMIEIWRDDTATSADWFVDAIKVELFPQKETSIFPVLRWIEAENGSGKNRQKIMELDTILPQFDPNKEQRARELERKRESYRIKDIRGMPIQVQKLPKDEQFSNEYMKTLIFSILENIYQDIRKKETVCKWNSFEDIDKLYDSKRPKPLAADFWKEDSWFAHERLNGCNPDLITLCTKIPEKLGVDEKMMEPVLNGETLASLIEKKRLFYIDLAILDGLLHNNEFEICAPIALFMLNDRDELMPIAIQLNQQKGPENPVFLPTDDYYVWIMAKLWYNLADCSYHQSLFHLGWTHFLMEGVILAMHRHICITHPIFKLMAPHTLFLLAINAKAVNVLVSKGGWVDTTMAIGANGMYDLVSRGMGKWSFDLQGTPPAKFKSRNVEDPEVLPNYHFRDDSLIIYEIIKTYVKNYVNLYYDNDQVLLNDWEIQNWAEAMARDQSEGGMGLAGVPERDGKGGVNTIEELVMLLSAIIYTCSAGHAAANFLQYATYGYPPNYPPRIQGNVINDKNPRTSTDVLKSLPDRNVTLSVMTITDLLSQKATKSLGDFEIQYIYDPKGLIIVDKFRADLKAASIKMKKRNEKLEFPYEILFPEHIPNAISI